MAYGFVPFSMTLNHWRSFVRSEVFRIEFDEHFFEHFARLQLTQRVVQSLGDSWASCLIYCCSLCVTRGTCEWHTEHVHAVFGPPAILCSVRHSPLLYQAQQHRQSVNSILLAVPRLRSAAEFSIEDVPEIWMKLPSITTIVPHFHSRLKRTLFSSFFYRKRRLSSAKLTARISSRYRWFLAYTIVV